MSQHGADEPGVDKALPIIQRESMLHDRLLNSWYIVLVVFAVLTFFFDRSNKEFEGKVNGKEHFRFEDIGAKENFYPQIFSPTNRVEGGFREKLSPLYWKKWNEVIDDPKSGDARKVYTRIFWIDNVWALFLIMLVYQLSFLFGKSRKPKEFLAMVLLVAFFADLMENISYLGHTGELAMWIPAICRVKMVLYLGGGAISLIFLAGNILSRLRKGTGG